MSTFEFDAFDYQADQSFTRARYRFEGSPENGWHIDRDDQRILKLGPGYRALRVRECGVCSTDLARHFLRDLSTLPDVDNFAASGIEQAQIINQGYRRLLFAAFTPDWPEDFVAILNHQNAGEPGFGGCAVEHKLSAHDAHNLCNKLRRRAAICVTEY